MFGIFHLFGRSSELKALDHALREAGLHPQTVSEAVKLTTLRLLKAEERAGAKPSEAAYHEAGQLLGYCLLGREEFIASNDVHTADHAERRLQDAIAAGDSLDAQLVLLTLHAGVVASDVCDRFGLDTG